MIRHMVFPEQKGLVWGKGILIAIGMTLFQWNMVFAQGPDNPHLSMNIVSGNTVEFNFNTIEQWTNGIEFGGQITNIRIGALGNWKLEYSANDIQFYGVDDPANQMPLDNVGVQIVSTGTNFDDGSNIINYAKSSAVALSDSEVLLLINGPLGNKGHGIRNTFLLNWEMGTRDGNMNGQTLLEQGIKADTYEMTITFTLTEVP